MPSRRCFARGNNTARAALRKMRAKTKITKLIYMIIFWNSRARAARAARARTPLRAKHGIPPHAARARRMPPQRGIPAQRAAFDAVRMILSRMTQRDRYYTPYIIEAIYARRAAVACAPAPATRRLFCAKRLLLLFDDDAAASAEVRRQRHNKKRY